MTHLTTFRRLHRRSASRGSSLIEFAFILFTLLLVMFAGLELDRMLFVYSNLTDAAKAGVRYAITHGNNRTAGLAAGPGTNPPAVVAVIKNYVSGVDQTSADFIVEVTYPAGTNASGDPVKAVIRYKYDPLPLLPGLKVWLGATSRGIITY